MAKKQDFYQLLGVSKTATADEIKKAYKALARKHHPDLNPGDKSAEEKFKAISEAYSVLGDEKARAQYDRTGTTGPMPDFGGAGGPGGIHWEDVLKNFDQRQAARGGGPGASGAGFGFEDIFGELFGGGMGGGRRGGRRAQAGHDVEVEVELPFMTALRGGTMPIKVDIGGRVEAIQLKVPPGTRDAARIRIPGKGQSGLGGGPNGDLFLIAKVLPHAFLRRDGDDLHLDVPVTFAEAALGGRIEVPTLHGKKTLKLGPGTQGGQKIRISGEGAPRKDGGSGDFYVHVNVAVPKNLDEHGQKLVRELDSRASMDPRAGLEL